ncbi:MAG: hypothetical protein M1469_01270 [Bacteroidetes bacterium]|nr:hypothetical protein [Bacteroidota bacterium]
MWQIPIRGGNWDNGSNAGLFALNLNNPRSNVNNNIGFRPALDFARCRQLIGLAASAFTKGILFLSERRNSPTWAGLLRVPKGIGRRRYCV